MDNMINKIFNSFPSFNTVQYSLIHLIKHFKFVRVEGNLEKQWRTFTRVRLWRKLKRDGQLNQLRFCIFAFLFKSKWPALSSSLQNFLVMPHHSLTHCGTKTVNDGQMALYLWVIGIIRTRKFTTMISRKWEKNTLRLKNSKYELRFITIKV